jgi:pimeloyl-ACP methyl ester carboxylesterase
LTEAFAPQVPPDDYVRFATSSWLDRGHLRAYLEDEWNLNASLKKLSKHYSEIRVRVVIVTGTEDKIVSPGSNAHRLNASIPQSQLIEIKDTGHEIPLTRPESIYQALMLISTSASR